MKESIKRTIFDLFSTLAVFFVIASPVVYIETNKMYSPDRAVEYVATVRDVKNQKTDDKVSVTIVTQEYTAVLKVIDVPTTYIDMEQLYLIEVGDEIVFKVDKLDDLDFSPFVLIKSFKINGDDIISFDNYIEYSKSEKYVLFMLITFVLALSIILIVVNMKKSRRKKDRK